MWGLDLGTSPCLLFHYSWYLIYVTSRHLIVHLIDSEDPTAPENCMLKGKKIKSWNGSYLDKCLLFFYSTFIYER